MNAPFSFSVKSFPCVSFGPGLPLWDVCASILACVLSLADFQFLLHLLSAMWWKEHGLFPTTHTLGCILTQPLWRRVTLARSPFVQESCLGSPVCLSGSDEITSLRHLIQFSVGNRLAKHPWALSLLPFGLSRPRVTSQGHSNCISFLLLP